MFENVQIIRRITIIFASQTHCSWLLLVIYKKNIETATSTQLYQTVHEILSKFKLFF